MGNKVITVSVGIVIIAILCQAPTIFAQVNQTSTNGTNISYRNGGGAGYTEVQNQIKNFLTDKNMEQNATNLMDKNTLNQRNTIHSLEQANPPSTYNATTNWVKIKPTLAHDYSGYAIRNQANWYQIQQAENTKSIEQNLKAYLANGRNGVPAFITCESWHNCLQKPFNGSVTIQQQNEVLANSTMGNFTHYPPLKPEFSAYPSGWDENNGTIHNYTELQAWLNARNSNETFAFDNQTNQSMKIVMVPETKNQTRELNQTAETQYIAQQLREYIKDSQNQTLGQDLCEKWNDCHLNVFNIFGHQTNASSYMKSTK